MAKFLELEKQSHFMTEPLQTNPSTSKEVDDDMREPTASLEHTSHVPYEVRTEGPLTYFHYYFEEDATAENRIDAAQPPATKFSPNRYLIGAGVLTATALSGLAVAEMSKPPVAAKPNAPEPSVQQPTPKAIDASKRLNLIGTEVQPLPSNQPLWSNQSSPMGSKAPIAQLTSGATTVQRPLNDESQKQLVTDPSNALGTRSQPLPLKPLVFPKPTSGMSLAQKTKPVTTLKQTGLPPTPMRPQTLQPPALQPSSSPQPLAQTTVPTATKRLPAPSVAGIARPETLAPQAAPVLTRAQAPMSMPTQTALPAPALPTQSLAQGNQRLELAPPSQAVTDGQTANPPLNEQNVSATSAMQEDVGALPIDSVIPQSLQDLLKRSRPAASDKSVTILPLTQKAAEDIFAISKAGVASKQLERFTILYLNQQDYQQAWLARHQAPQQLASIDAFPTYGFVDYHDRIIAVLDQKQPLQTSSLPTSF